MDHESEYGSVGPCGDLGSGHWPLSLAECGFPGGGGGSATLAWDACNITVQCANTGIVFVVQWKTDWKTEGLVSRSSECCFPLSGLSYKYFR